jgi:hypothetical protein
VKLTDEEQAAALEKLEARRQSFLASIKLFTDRAYDEGKDEGMRADKRKGAQTTNSPWAESRAYCVRRAAEIWADTPGRRIGEVAKALFDELPAQRMKTPAEYSKVAGWLRKANKQGLLVIPPEARKGGRPRKK